MSAGADLVINIGVVGIQELQSAFTQLVDSLSNIQSQFADLSSSVSASLSEVQSTATTTSTEVSSSLSEMSAGAAEAGSGIATGLAEGQTSLDEFLGVVDSTSSEVVGALDEMASGTASVGGEIASGLAEVGPAITGDISEISSAALEMDTTLSEAGANLNLNFEEADATLSQIATRSPAAASGLQGIASAGMGIAGVGIAIGGLAQSYMFLSDSQTRVEQAESRLSSAEARDITAHQALNKLVAEGITSGPLYQKALDNVNAADLRLEAAHERTSEAIRNQQFAYMNFATQAITTGFFAFQGITQAVRAFAPAGEENVGLLARLGSTGGIVGLAIAGVAAAYLILHYNVGGVTTALEGFGKQLGDAVPAARPLLTFIQALASEVGIGSMKTSDATRIINQDFASVGQAVGGFANQVQQTLGGIWNWINQNFISPVEKGWAALGVAFNNFAGDPIGAIQKAFQPIFDWVNNTVFKPLAQAWGILATTFNTFAGHAFQAFQAAFGSIVSWFQGIYNDLAGGWAALANIFKAFSANPFQVFQQAFGNIVNWFQGIYNDLTQGWGTLVKDFNVFAADPYGEITKAFNDIGSWFTTNVLNPLENGWNTLVKDFNTFAADPLGTMQKAFGNMPQWFEQNVLSPMQKDAASLAQALTDAFKGIAPPQAKSPTGGQPNLDNPQPFTSDFPSSGTKQGGTGGQDSVHQALQQQLQDLHMTHQAWIEYTQSVRDSSGASAQAATSTDAFDTASTSLKNALTGLDFTTQENVSFTSAMTKAFAQGHDEIIKNVAATVQEVGALTPLNEKQQQAVIATANWVVQMSAASKVVQQVTTNTAAYAVAVAQGVTAADKWFATMSTGAVATNAEIGQLEQLGQVFGATLPAGMEKSTKNFQDMITAVNAVRNGFAQADAATRTWEEDQLKDFSAVQSGGEQMFNEIANNMKTASGQFTNFAGMWQKLPADLQAAFSKIPNFQTAFAALLNDRQSLEDFVGGIGIAMATGGTQGAQKFVDAFKPALENMANRALTSLNPILQKDGADLIFALQTGTTQQIASAASKLQEDVKNNMFGGQFIGAGSGAAMTAGQKIGEMWNQAVDRALNSGSALLRQDAIKITQDIAKGLDPTADEAKLAADWKNVMHTSITSAGTDASTAANTVGQTAGTQVGTGMQQTSPTAIAQAFNRMTGDIEGDTGIITAAIQQMVRTGFINSFATGLTQLEGVVNSGFTKITSTITTNLTTATRNIQQFVTNAFVNSLGKGADNVFLVITRDFDTIQNNINTDMTKAFNAVRTNTSNMLSTVNTNFNSILNTINSDMNNAVRDVQNAGSRIISEFNAIGSSARAQIGSINSLASAINSLHDRTVTIHVVKVFSTVGSPSGFGGATGAGGFTTALNTTAAPTGIGSNQPVNINLYMDGKQVARIVKKNMFDLIGGH